MNRRTFLIQASTGFFALTNSSMLKIMAAAETTISTDSDSAMREDRTDDDSALITMFLCGDVMTGRGIDQVLPHPGDPILYESYVKTARRYVDLAEEMNGPISKPVGFPYIWGDALEVFAERMPQVRIINLETSVTTNDNPWPNKAVLYRMHPENVTCLTAADIDCCVLSNNHVLDWDYDGLEETIRTLRTANIKTAGAGATRQEAEAPAIIDVDGRGRVLVFAFGSESGGVFAQWAATKRKGGVNLLEDLSAATVQRIAKAVQNVKRSGDVAVASIHWGPNWGYAIERAHVRFAHQLIDGASIDVVHGHSSHHAKAIEVYKGKPIIYGCGDFISDYEGIGGYERFRGDLGLMYFVTVNAETGQLTELSMVPTQMKQFKIHRASKADARWLQQMLSREGSQFDNQAHLDTNNNLALVWATPVA